MKRARSNAYPVLDLAAAYKILRHDLAGLGAAELSRDEVAKKIGYHDAIGGLAARKVGALAHYGLLVRRGGKYGLSPLGLRLQTLDIHDAEFSSAICAALEHPTLFRAILDRYGVVGRLPHSLAEELAPFGITENASEDAAEVFRNSALFAGLLNTEGVLRSGPLVLPSPVLPLSDVSPIYDSNGNKESDQIEIPLLLPEGRKGSMILPRPFGETDYRALKESFLAAYKLLPTHLGIVISSARENGSSARVGFQKSKPPLPFPKPPRPRR
jgi:hypothetical protein